MFWFKFRGTWSVNKSTFAVPVFAAPETLYFTVERTVNKRFMKAEQMVNTRWKKRFVDAERFVDKRWTDWLVTYGFTFRSKIFHLHENVTIAGEGHTMGRGRYILTRILTSWM
jgi:hypothetical protein